jgi:hypothetical protein
MKTGIIVDGVAEFRSLPSILQRIAKSTEVVKILKADIQPMAPVGQIVRAAASRLITLGAKGAELAIILIDLESRNTCSGSWAEELRNAFGIKCAECGITSCEVVVKTRTFENWLVGDPGVFAQMPARFSISEKNRAAVLGKADNVDALRVMRATVRRPPFDKVADAVAIMAHADPYTIACNSRSFRRFLRVIGNSRYAAQSVRPMCRSAT